MPWRPVKFFDSAERRSALHVRSPAFNWSRVRTLSSFTTLAGIARSLSYTWLPVSLQLSQKFDAVDEIADVRMPVIVLHGERDRYVPVDLGRKLFDAAPGPKRLVVVEDGTHNNSLRLGARDMHRAFGDVFALRAPAT